MESSSSWPRLGLAARLLGFASCVSRFSRFSRFSRGSRFSFRSPFAFFDRFFSRGVDEATSSTTDILPSVASFLGVFFDEERWDLSRFECFERCCCYRRDSAGSSLDSRESLTIVTFAFVLFFFPDLSGFRWTLGASAEDSSSAKDAFCLEECLATEACFDIDLECFDFFDFLDVLESSLIEARDRLFLAGAIVDCEGTYPSLMIIL